MTLPALSALVVARDEEAQLDACLSPLAFADELVVVLDRCVDGSKAIAERHDARIVEGNWPSEGQRRNAGIEACTGDWILEVDADERVSDELAAEIRARIQTAPFGYFLIPYDNYIGNHLVRYGWGAHWGVSATARLFHKGAKVWGDGRLHPPVELKGQRGQLDARMNHFVDRDISDMLQRLDRYTTQHARDLRDARLPNSMTRDVRRIFTRFLKCYVVRRGYREGGYGFLIALMAGLYPILSHLKARLEAD